MGSSTFEANLNTEHHLIATLITYPEALADVSGMLKSDDFDRPALAEIYSAMVSMSSRGDGFDLITLRGELEAKGKLAAAGGEPLLMELAAAFSASAAFAQEHAKIVTADAVRRRVVKGLAMVLEASKDAANGVNELAGMIERVALEAASTRQEKELSPLSDYLAQIWKTWEAQARGEVTGLRTGFRDIDSHTCGFQPTDFIVLGGRPGMGKTSFALEIMGNVCRRGGTGAFFELEMSAWQVAARAILQRARVNSQSLRMGSPAKRDLEKLKEIADLIRNDKLYFDDTAGITPLQVLSKCRKLKAKRGLDLVVVDNIQIMKGDGNYRGNRRQELADVSNSMKRLAKSIECPVIGISHLNRESAKSGDPRPSLHDLK